MKDWHDFSNWFPNHQGGTRYPDDYQPPFVTASPRGQKPPDDAEDWPVCLRESDLLEAFTTSLWHNTYEIMDYLIEHRVVPQGRCSDFYSDLDLMLSQLVKKGWVIKTVHHSCDLYRKARD